MGVPGFRSLRRLSQDVSWGCTHWKAGLGLEDLLPGGSLAAWQDGLAIGRLSLLHHGPLDRISGVSSQGGG